MKKLNNSRDVVAALGGVDAVASLTGRHYKSVSRWQAAKEAFPPTLYVAMQSALVEIGFRGDPAMWGMEEPVRRPLAKSA
jgi:hypothetical protein